MKNTSLVMVLLLVGACKAAPDPKSGEHATPPISLDDGSLRFADGPGAGGADAPALHAQVVLDQLGFSPGVIDGAEGQSYAAALRGFQVAKGLDPTGRLDAATSQAMQPWQHRPATRSVVIPAAFARGPFFPAFPKDAAAQARLPALGYRNLMEALAERFHTTPEFLAALNGPETRIGAGRVIRVPNIPDVDPATLGPDIRGWNDRLQRLGVSPRQAEARKIVVDKSEGVLKAYDGDGRLIAQFSATMGSRHDPLPIGAWKIQGVVRNPDFHYNPKLFWDVSDAKRAVMLKPGPNSPVGVVWLDLSKPHYGIHGTSEPRTIGRTESHGCVRLTNWDAARLAQMVKPGTPAILQE